LEKTNYPRYFNITSKKVPEAGIASATFQHTRLYAAEIRDLPLLNHFPIVQYRYIIGIDNRT
jgi:hypothetical protein